MWLQYGFHGGFAQISLVEDVEIQRVRLQVTSITAVSHTPTPRAQNKTPHLLLTGFRSLVFRLCYFGPMSCGTAPLIFGAVFTIFFQ